jgi:hypothetical protein
MFQPFETTDLPLAEVTPHPTAMAMRMVVMMLVLPHIKIHGCPCSLLLKSQGHPAFSQTSMKPLSKYHHKIYFVSHKNELASTVVVNKLRKINKEELRYEITGTSKESTQRQRKSVN